MTRLERPSWEDYRRRRKVLWIAFIGYLPVGAIVGLPLNGILGSELPVIVLALVWMGIFAYAVVRMDSFPCPRCGMPFFSRPFVQNPLAQRCMRCGWPKWLERNAALTAAPHNPPLERPGPEK